MTFKGWPVLRTSARKPPPSFSFLDIWAPGDSRVLENNATIRLLRANLANIRSEVRFLNEVHKNLFPAVVPRPAWGGRVDDGDSMTEKENDLVNPSEEDTF